jgi:hypothetical protein
LLHETNGYPELRLVVCLALRNGVETVYIALGALNIKELRGGNNRGNVFGTGDSVSFNGYCSFSSW